MSMRVCAEPGCGTLIRAGTRDGRCTAHRRGLEQARGTRQARGYDAAYDRLRAAYVSRMNAGEVFWCWRCGVRIDPAAFDLGHDDHDRSIVRGPECRPCNRATATRR